MTAAQLTFAEAGIVTESGPGKSFTTSNDIRFPTVHKSLNAEGGGTGPVDAKAT
jgi:hypothetical protein